uniref:KIB1-4 beta-propeller domain-containing protein n=1 Tax=Oryza punctata TaxID=4537 RepID=A0A0E0MCJ1_ORYPU
MEGDGVKRAVVVVAGDDDDDELFELDIAMLDRHYYHHQLDDDDRIRSEGEGEEDGGGDALLANCLLPFPDLFSSAAVCASWRATFRALFGLGIYTRPQTLCLFYTSTAAGARVSELYSVAAGMSYTLPDLPDPPITERYIFGASHGWLVTADARSELHLLNPATGEQVELPSITSVEHVAAVLDGADELVRYDLSFYGTVIPRRETQPPQPYGLDELREVLYIKVVLSCDPSRCGAGDDYVVMLIHNPNRQLSFARVIGLGGGERRWHWVSNSLPCAEYSDCIYHDGAFHAMILQGRIHRYTIQGSRAKLDVVFEDTLPYIADHMYVARTSSGNLLQIWRITDDPTDELPEMHTLDFDIYKIDFDKQDILNIDTLGDDAFIVGNSYTCFLSTMDFPKLLPGCVYFNEHSEYWLMDSKDTRKDIGIYSFEDKSVQELVSPHPGLTWPNPIWIMLSFTKIK